jgi:hypothetical protein
VQHIYRIELAVMDRQDESLAFETVYTDSGRGRLVGAGPELAEADWGSVQGRKVLEPVGADKDREQD